MKKKKWVIALAVLALVIAAAFPVRAAVREYRFRQSLVVTYENFARNTVHVSLGADIMCELIDQALEAEDPVEARENLLAVYVWASDITDTLYCTDSYVRFYRSAYRIYQENRAWALTPELHGAQYMRDGFVHLENYLRPYITGETGLEDETFRETLRNVQTDLRWLQSVWEEAFADVDSMSDEELVIAHEALFGRMEWLDFFQSVSQQN